jgi:AraC-like DNA-binding protein
MLRDYYTLESCMHMKEWTQFWHHPQLDIRLLRAFYVQHAYPRHSHDYYVLCVIEGGLQSFTHAGIKHTTPPGGVILLNPGAAHTGEPATASGFQMRSIYPTAAHMQMALEELTGRHHTLPLFPAVRIDDRWAMNSLVLLHQTLAHGADLLETESRFLWTLTQLIKRYANISVAEQRLGAESDAIRRARRYIDEHFMHGISLRQIAAHVSLSPYYLLRAFRSHTGMPPYAYLESVRIRQAQRLIELGKPLVEVAGEVGFSSQSHLTHRFKQIIGVTPGQYAQQRR